MRTKMTASMKFMLTVLLLAVFAFACEAQKLKEASDSHLKTLPINIKQEMPYVEAREKLLGDGWQTVTAHRTPNGTPVCFKVADLDPYEDPEDYESLINTEACGYEEIDDCSGSGMGFCKMIFFDGDKTYLDLITVGGEPPDATVEGWSKVAAKDFNQ